jgi:hypothetical protein
VITKHAIQHRTDQRCRQAPHARACRHPENSPGAGENVTIFLSVELRSSFAIAFLFRFAGL